MSDNILCDCLSWQQNEIKPHTNVTGNLLWVVPCLLDLNNLECRSWDEDFFGLKLYLEEPRIVINEE